MDLKAQKVEDPLMFTYLASALEFQQLWTSLLQVGCSLLSYTWLRNPKTLRRCATRA